MCHLQEAVEKFVKKSIKKPIFDEDLRTDKHFKKSYENLSALLLLLCVCLRSERSISRTYTYLYAPVKVSWSLYCIFFLVFFSTICRSLAGKASITPKDVYGMVLLFFVFPYSVDWGKKLNFTIPPERPPVRCFVDYRVCMCVIRSLGKREDETSENHSKTQIYYLCRCKNRLNGALLWHFGIYM